MIGPGALYAVIAHPARRQASGPRPNCFFTRGWLKLDAKPPGARREDTDAASTVSASDAAAVVHVTGDAVEDVRRDWSREDEQAAKPDTSGSEAKAGEYAGRAAGKPIDSSAKARSVFIAAMPRDFMDPLPKRAAKFASARPDPAPDRDATFAEAQPWLTGPYRTAFMKRFEPKLSDPAFRTAAEASGRVLPEWSAAAKPKAEPVPPPKEKETEEEEKEEKEKEKPKEPARTWHWPWETPRK